MKLKPYLQALTPDEREAFAQDCQTTLGHLRNVMYGYRPCSALLAADIERASAAAVTRQDMCPSDWVRIWPELADTATVEPAHPAPTPTPAAQAAQQRVA